MTQLSELLKQVKNLEIKSKNLVEGMESGMYRSRFRGGGIEFSEVREYTAGDDIRRVDWNVSAKHNSLFVKEFVEEKELNVYVVMDLSASNDFGFEKSKKELGYEVAASIMFSALKNNDRIGLGLFTESLEQFVPAKKGKHHMLKLLQRFIDYNTENTSTNILKSLSQLNNKLKRRSGIFIISDFISDSFLQPLKFLNHRHQVILVNISDKRETEIPKLGNVFLEDAESGEQILVNTSDKKFQEQYTNYFHETEDKIKNEIKKLGIDMMYLSNEESFELTFKKYFRNKNRSRK